MTRPWWFKPLRAVGVGLAIGLTFSWVLSLLPPRVAAAAWIVFIVGMLSWCFWALGDLKRDMVKARQAVVDYEKIYGRYEP